MADRMDRLTQEGSRLREMLEELDSLEVRVGFQAGQSNDDNGVDICDIAAWNELGTSTGIPARPFIRNTADNHENEINRFATNLVKKLCSGELTAEEMLKKLGVYVKGLMQKEIKDGDYIPNAPSTIAKKSSDKPLIDTGRMRQSVNYVIKEKGGSD